jgi:hypothetical protein
MFIKFDRDHHGGQMSPTGVELLAAMPFEIAQQQVAETNKKVPVKPGPDPVARAAPSTPATPISAPAPAASGGTEGKAVPKLEGAADGHAVGSDAHASRGGPAGTWTPPANAHLTDASLAQLGAQLHDAKADQVLVDLAGVTAVAAAMKPHLTNKVEAAGPERENLVAGIRAVREGLLSMAGGDPKVEAFKVAVNHKLEALSPYYSQTNIRTIESGAYTTCNVTSLAMSLSAIGKNADAYLPAKIPHIVAVAKHFHGDMAKAAHTNGPKGDVENAESAQVWAQLRGMRLPDFMSLAAVATNIHSATPTDGEIKTAAATAVKMKTHLPFLAQVAHDFGANTTFQSAVFNKSKNAALASFAGQHGGEVNQLVDARHRAEANPGNKRFQEHYQQLRAEQEKKINGGAIEKSLPLADYKQTVMATIKPLLDSGAGVVSSTINHFTHCFEMTDEHISVQDPGQWARAERKILWDEARALQYFWNYLVVR